MAAAPDRLLRRLEWRLGRRLDGRLQGAYRTVWHGTGVDFTDLRAYTAEDDVRHIDWNVTARLDEPFVRQYTEDRELTAWLVIDKSASMKFGGHQGKDAVATELAVSLAKLCRRAVTGSGRSCSTTAPSGCSRRAPGATRCCASRTSC